jgi:subtilisin-like proprotein convertase family protein
MVRVRLDLANNTYANAAVELVGPEGIHVSIDPKTPTWDITLPQNTSTAGIWALRFTNNSGYTATLNSCSLEFSVSSAASVPYDQGRVRAQSTWDQINNPPEIYDNNNTGVVQYIDVSATGTVRSARVQLGIVEDTMGDLVVELHSPDGKIAYLWNRQGGNNDNLYATIEANNNPNNLVGANVNGRWTLIAKDVSGEFFRNTHYLSYFALDLVAGDPTVNSTYKIVGVNSDSAKLVIDNNYTGASEALTIDADLPIQALRVQVGIDHTRRGDLHVHLVDPTGADHTLQYTSGVTDDDLYTTYTVDGMTGKRTKGLWTLKVADEVANYEQGELRLFALDFDLGLYCNDKVCSNGETYQSCPADCPPPAALCGNGWCGDPGETCATCPQDCTQCAADCGGPAVCANQIPANPVSTTASGGYINVKYQGAAKGTYVVRYKTQLVGGAWSCEPNTIASNLDGTFSFSDPIKPGTTSKFYEVYACPNH